MNSDMHDYIETVFRKNKIGSFEIERSSDRLKSIKHWKLRKFLFRSTSEQLGWSESFGCSRFVVHFILLKLCYIKRILAQPKKNSGQNC